MKISRIAAIGAIALAAAAAHAAPTNIAGTTSPVTGGTFDYSGTKDSSFYVLLDAGTYSFQSQVDAQGEQLAGAWFSYSQAKNQGGKDDIADFTSITSQSFAGSVASLTLAAPTKIFVDVNTILGKKAGKDASFEGTLTISPVPEPATTALLLAGLGMIGFVGRRRRKNV